MAEKHQQQGCPGILRTASSGVLRRSSSVEILAGITPIKVGLTSPANKNSDQTMTNESGGDLSTMLSSIDFIDDSPSATPLDTNVAPTASATGRMSPPNATVSTLSSNDTEAVTKAGPTAPKTAFPKYNGCFASKTRDKIAKAPVNPPSNFLNLKLYSPATCRRKNRLAELKANVRNMLPPLVTTHKVDQTSPSGSPIIKERAHVFTIVPSVKREAVGAPQKPATVVPCEGDPFDQRRKISPSASLQSEEVEEDKEPVWQRRLSQLFVPPTDNELEPEKEPEESSQLLPKPPSGLILQKQVSSSSSSLDNQPKKDKEADRGSERKKRESRRKVGVTEEKDKPKNQPRIIFQDAKVKKEEEELPAPGTLDDAHGSDASSSLSTSDEEDAAADDYTSWDDTICSNRSAYFKKYYTQRGIIGGNRGEDKSIKVFAAASENSLSSLIREKMGKSQQPARKTRADLGLMVLVLSLFIIIVLGISLTTYFYNLHLLELSIFNCIKFYETPRILEIYNKDWKPLTTVHLGTTLSANAIPEDCTHYLHYLQRHNYSMRHQRIDEDYEDMICLDWTDMAQLHLRKLYAEGDIQCYSVWWGAAHEHMKLRDCLKADTEHGVWWGGGEMSEGGYPVTNAHIAPIKMVTGKLGRDSWGQLLRRTWLSNRASLLTLPENFRGEVSINYESDGQVCFESGPSLSVIAPLPTMKYHLCTGPNLTSLIYFMQKQAVMKRKIVAESASSLVTHVFEVEEKETIGSPQSHPDAAGHQNVSRTIRGILKEIFKEEVKERVQERLEHPVWIPWMPPQYSAITQAAVLEYVDSILSKNYGFWGHVLLPSSWQSKPGSLEFDFERFPDPSSLEQKLETKGFRLALTIHPFVSVHTSAFNAGTKENLWVRQRNSSLPALANYDDRYPSVVTDFSNPRAKEWFSSRLQHLQKSYKIDRFHLQPADAHALPVFHEYHAPLPGPDSVLVHFLAAVTAVSPPVSTEGAVTPPMPPTFLTLGTADESWKGLETLVPRVLTLAMLGYPLVDVGPIGGVARDGHVPERELYIRWLEAATFLPAMQISVLPHTYDHEVVNLAAEYSEIRKNIVLPRILKNISSSLELGTPLLYPLALFAPDDSEAAKVDNQWILGEDLLVAPVTQRGKRARSIYLPEGIWKDEIDGHLRRGGRWIKNYKVPLTKTPHFTLKSIDDQV
ncbi:hypothetical protein OTU49_012949 [Cherax quadricarinatus]|uniref:Uncharacterized protein n=2 Tax=Cherax quadricarinatus TaxID=27406 RepID=A0AAW0VVL2_CHEQU